MKELKQRLFWLDSLRGFLILLVILGHCIQDIDQDFENNYFWNLIYSFHMAAFMAISGYVAYKGNLQYNQIGKRIIELLLPFFVWTILTNITKENFFQNIYEVILHPDHSFWFLWVLFFIILFFHIADSVSIFLMCKQEYVVVAFAGLFILLMVVFDFRLFGFQFIALYFLFYSLGFYLRKYSTEFFKNRIFIVLLFILWFVGASFWKMHDLPFFLKMITFVPNSLMLYFYRILVALLAILFLISAGPTIFNGSNIINKCLIYFGKITLGIYVIHLGLPFFKVFKDFNFITDNILVYFLLRLGISILLIELINFSKIAKFLLLGKQVRKNIK